MMTVKLNSLLNCPEILDPWRSKPLKTQTLWKLSRHTERAQGKLRWLVSVM
jgi:hypothetical protein